MRFATGALVDTTPVTAIAECVVPWNPPEKATTSPRPVAVLHSFSAASTAFAPVGPQKCTRIRSRIAVGQHRQLRGGERVLGRRRQVEPVAEPPSCSAATSTSSG